MRQSRPAESFASRTTQRRPRTPQRAANAAARGPDSDDSGQTAAAAAAKGPFEPDGHTKGTQGGAEGRTRGRTAGGPAGGTPGATAANTDSQRAKASDDGGGGRKQPERSEDNCGGLTTGSRYKQRLCRFDIRVPYDMPDLAATDYATAAQRYH
jgi:hypothetical protein